ncbi:MAG: MoaD/ThiS family protein [Leptospiraceae bacterium]|nr:MoaD/ThiS family protein [Leptospiraceae bacterium]MCP5499825.1 MoaD/ThiS family protein [Leptospiraceae bacterium]
MLITIKTFAGLKNYFPAEFKLEIKKENTIKDILEILKQQKPEGSSLLELCFASNEEELIAGDYIPFEGEAIHIMPPVSGG